LSGLACTPHNESEIIGKYVYESEQEQEQIVLKPNHTYIRNYLEKQTNQSKQETGTWDYDHIGGPHVNLNYRDSKNPAKDEVDSKAIEKWFGKLYLGMSDDGGRLYKKID
jgi:hypothetical protein